MNSLLDNINEWIKQGLIEAIMGSFADMFDSINQQVGDVATQIGTTPAGYNPGVYSMIQTLSETIIIPIAGMILTFILCYELIQMLIERNNMHDDVLCKRGISSAYNNVNGGQLTYGKASWQPTRKVVLDKVFCTHGV